MLEWTHLGEIPTPEWDSAELKKQREPVNKEILSILEERDRIDGILGKVQNTSIADLDLKEMRAARKAKDDRFELVRRELKLRKGPLTEYEEAERARLWEGAREAEKEAEQIRKEIGEKLESIGYLNPEKTTLGVQAPGTYKPDMVHCHPRHLAVFFRAKEWADIARSPRGNNLQAIEEVTRQMESAGRELMGVSL